MPGGAVNGVAWGCTYAQYAYPTMLETEINGKAQLLSIYAVMRKDPALRLVSLGMRVASFPLDGVA